MFDKSRLSVIIFIDKPTVGLRIGEVMARTVKEEEYAIKRKEIVAAAQRLVYTKGYDQMSIQDILNELKISKGAFYHYFGSKQALLEALIDQMTDEAEPIIAPIANDPNLPALEKLHRFFDTAARWKTARKEYLLLLMQGWYADENALMREKAQNRMIEHFSPLLAGIIRQGIAEGVMNSPFPDQIASMAFALLVSMGYAYMDLLSHNAATHHELQRAIDLVEAYNVVLERMLGAATGSIKLMDMKILADWFGSPDAVTSGNEPVQLQR
jgi:AcrR family transcriptional regulator